MSSTDWKDVLSVRALASAGIRFSRRRFCCATTACSTSGVLSWFFFYILASSLAVRLARTAAVLVATVKG
jgi:hypothetical protein